MKYKRITALVLSMTLAFSTVITASAEEKYYGYRPAEDFYYESIGEAVENTDSPYLDVAYADRYFNPVEEYGIAALPPVRNQGDFGCCWAFATMATLEFDSYLKQKKAVDVSENHLARFTYNSVPDVFGGTAGDTNSCKVDMEVMKEASDELKAELKAFPLSERNKLAYLFPGGNPGFASNILMTGQGVALESTFPYPKSGTEALNLVNNTDLNAIAYKDEYRAVGTALLQIGIKDNDSESVIIANRNAVKNYIKTYGAGTICYHEDSDYYLEDTNCFYCYDKKAGANHMITVVGWDDGAYASNFTQINPKTGKEETPEGDGAWLVRNSWGSNDYDHSGYFWISYYDKTIAEDPSLFITYKPVFEYNNLYQYDGGMDSGQLDKVSAIGNIFYTGVGSEALKAVAFSIASANVRYTVKVYGAKQFDSTDPTREVVKANGEYESRKATLLTNQSGVTGAAGFTYVTLDNYPIFEDKDQPFSVVIEFEKPVTVYTEFERDASWYATKVSVPQSTSFELYEGTWIDMSTFEPYETGERFGNLRIKAYTIDGGRGGDEDPDNRELIYTDINEKAWYFRAIKYVSNNRIMIGTDEVSFKPYQYCTREQLATILYNKAGKPDVSYKPSFKDVPDNMWYSKPVIWAYNNKLTAGVGNDRFGVGRYVTREQVAVFLYNNAKLEGKDVSAQADLSKYKDASKINDWAKTAMSWANAKGIINGTDASLLNPQGTATRAEIAQMIYNYADAL